MIRIYSVDEMSKGRNVRLPLQISVKCLRCVLGNFSTNVTVDRDVLSFKD